MLDKLTYATASPEALADLPSDRRRELVVGDVGRRAAVVDPLVAAHDGRKVVHLAAESHNDNSLDDPAPFVRTNLVGTYVLTSRTVRRKAPTPDFHQVSTDEVYGDLALRRSEALPPRTRRTDEQPLLRRQEAASDHLVRAWVRRLRSPGHALELLQQLRPVAARGEVHPRQITEVLEGRRPRIGAAPAQQVRDWIHVDDHRLRPADRILDREIRIGEPYLVEDDSRSATNASRSCGCCYACSSRPEDDYELVADQATGHDQSATSRRRARLRLEEQGWQPRFERLLEQVLAETVAWYTAPPASGGRPTSTEPEAAYASRRSVMPDLAVERTPIPGLLVLRLDIRTDERGVVRGGLAAGEDDGPRASRLRARVQANIAWNERRGSTRGCTPSRGTKWSRSPRARRARRVGGPARGRRFRHDLQHGRPRARAWPSSCRAGSAATTRRWPTPRRTPIWSTTTGAPRRAYVAVDHADPALAIGRPVPLEERAVSRRTAMAPALDTRHPRRRTRRPLVLGADGQAQAGGTLTPMPPGARWRRTRTSSRSRATWMPSLERWPWGEPRSRPQRRGLHRGRPRRRDARRAARYRLDGQRRGLRHGTGPAGGLARLHARALLHRLRLRRVARPSNDEDEPLAPLRRVRPSPRPCRRPRSPRGRRTSPLRRAHLVGGQGRAELRNSAPWLDSAAEERDSLDRSRIRSVGSRSPTEMATADLHHLLDGRAPRGTYHLSNGEAPPLSWADVAREESSRPRGRRPERRLRPEISTEEYAGGRATAPRPTSSVLSCAGSRRPASTRSDARAALRTYASSLP